MTSSDREILIAIDGKVTALGERLDRDVKDIIKSELQEREAEGG